MPDEPAAPHDGRRDRGDNSERRTPGRSGCAEQAERGDCDDKLPSPLVGEGRGVRGHAGPISFSLWAWIQTVGWVEWSEPHREIREELVGLAALDPPYARKLIGPEGP